MFLVNSKCFYSKRFKIRIGCVLILKYEFVLRFMKSFMIDSVFISTNNRNMTKLVHVPVVIKRFLFLRFRH